MKGRLAVPIRSGRFKSDDATGSDSDPANDGRIQIIEGRGGAFYRIVNSGRHPFTIRVSGGGSSTTIELAPTFSLDIGGANRVRIETSTAVPIEGVYEYLNTERPIRSGRFKLELAPDAAHKIIDLAVGSGSGQIPTAYYRIFNSGEVDFKVWRGEGNSANDIGRVRPGDSLDFAVRGNGSKDIHIRRMEGATHTVVVDGIYEFLGQS
jgi:hypothetical protein